MFSSVVFPEPDSPMMAKYSPFSTEKVTLVRFFWRERILEKSGSVTWQSFAGKIWGSFSRILTYWTPFPCGTTFTSPWSCLACTMRKWPAGWPLWQKSQEKRKLFLHWESPFPVYWVYYSGSCSMTQGGGTGKIWRPNAYPLEPRAGGVL